MAPSAVALCKFIGTVSLGLLTGVSYTLSTLSLPSLLTLPSAKPAAHTLAVTTRLANLHIRTLSTLATTSLALAFYLSPARARHPYLLWTSAVAAGSGVMGIFQSTFKQEGRVFEVEGRGLGEVNGEEVERYARGLQLGEFARCAVSGVGFVMGVVGVWGDGS
ncbi:hypothetical protein MBLNU230_g8082t1 [Neophaeotheca triangularis]